MAQFDENGLVVDSFTEIEQKLIDAFKTSFGENVKTDSQSVIGQLIKNFSLVHTELHELLQQVVDQSNPQAASGNSLSNLVLLNGITRNPATSSEVDLTITANAACTIPIGSLVSDVEKTALWATKAAVSFTGAGSSTVRAACVNKGPIEAGASTLTEIQTPIFGWASVNNPSSATLGRLEESDSELRARRQLAAERSASTSVSNIYRVLTEVPEVNFVRVVANSSSATDEHGIPPTHVLCVVDGGADKDIAAAIHSTVGAGIGQSGSILYDYDDPVSGQTHTVRFSRPIDVQISIEMSITTNKDFPADGVDQIKENILNYFKTFQTIGQDVIFSRLYSPINSVPGHFVTSLTIGAHGSSGSVNIPIKLSEVAKTEDFLITVHVS